MKRKLFISLLASILVISTVVFAPNSTNTAEAQSLSEIRAKKAENEAKKKQKQSELSKVKSERINVQNQVKKIDTEMEKTTQKIVKNQEKIKENEEKIEQLEKEIKELEIRIAERDELLKERVRSMHVNGGAINYIEVLLGSKSFGDFLDRVFALNIIAEQDRAIIEEQKADKRALEESKAEVEKLLDKIKKEQKELEELKKKLKVQLDEKEKILADLKEKEEHLHEEYGELENIGKLIAAEEEAFKRMLAESKSSKKGSSSGGTSYSSSSGFIFPTSGAIVSRFRPPHRPNHNGIDISNRSKPPVKAVASGTVTRVVTGCGPRSTGCGSGYGNHVIITHNINGKKVSTLYAHLDNGTITVQIGQRVAQGTVIGRMGNSGNVSGPTGIHLHFEVHPGGYRGKSSAVNPCNWLGC